MNSDRLVESDGTNEGGKGERERRETEKADREKAVKRGRKGTS